MTNNIEHFQYNIICYNEVSDFEVVVSSEQLDSSMALGKRGREREREKGGEEEYFYKL